MICKYCSNDIKRNLNLHEISCKRVQEIKDEIKRLYKEENKSIKKISEIYKIGKFKILTIIGDDIRSPSESTKLGKKLYPLIGYKHTDESRQKMRVKRLEWMKNNPEKTAWRTSNFSYPERVFYKKLIELDFDKKYLIIREKHIHPYFVDFAFINEKVAVEIDGSQHLLPEKKEIDNKKDELLKSQDWRIFRVTANEVTHNISNVFDRLNCFIQSSIQYEVVGIFHNKEAKEKKYCECGNEICKVSKMCVNCNNILSRKINRPSIEILTNEVNELGYSGTGRKYGVSDNSIRKWIKVGKDK